MSKKKPPKPAVPEGGESPKPISYRPSKRVANGLEDYRSRFEFPPDKSKIIEKALVEFLRSKGIELSAADDE